MSPIMCRGFCVSVKDSRVLQIRYRDALDHWSIELGFLGTLGARKKNIYIYIARSIVLQIS